MQSFRCGKILIAICLFFTGQLEASFVVYTVEKNASLKPFTLKIDDQKGQFTAELRAFTVDTKGKTTFKAYKKTYVMDKLNPPLCWDKKEKQLGPKTSLSWGHLNKGKHIICIASLDEAGFLTLTYYDEVTPRHFRLTILSDPYLSEGEAAEKKLDDYYGNYVGRGNVAHVTAELDTVPERDIDFSLKKYSRGFKLVKSLSICPEGRENCTDGKRKNYKFYFKKNTGALSFQEEKGSFFKKSAPLQLRKKGYVQWALWHKGHLKTYMINYTPAHPLILEYAAWKFADKGGNYSYAKYIDAQLDKKVEGKFFKAKDDEEYIPQTR